jgi:hypothetical protein
LNIFAPRRSILSVALRIIESALGPFLIDDDLAAAPSRLELLALELDIDPDALRERLRDEVQERLRQRGASWEGLENLIEKREGNGRWAARICYRICYPTEVTWGVLRAPEGAWLRHTGLM